MRLHISKGRDLALSVYHTSTECDRGAIGFHFDIPFLVSFYLQLFEIKREPEDMWDYWGFTTHASGCGNTVPDSVHFGWGDKTRLFYMPWSWEHYRTSYLLPDGQSWAHFIDKKMKHLKGIERLDLQNSTERWKEVHSYQYTLNSGEVQDRIATIEVSESEFRRRWLMWCPLFARVKRWMDFEFSQEVGERSGSWKGGCIASSYELKDGETPLQCLRRMEKERTFR